ncbi:hypothetical protein WMY93_018071 [Mugilogobius chulae]|uniref:Protein kinase domain-containing protein n=1 Tax=Mugilogobius chulae TaxID=88201 RepID=A0AAW0NMQ4_9GOBI
MLQMCSVRFRFVQNILRPGLIMDQKNLSSELLSQSKNHSFCSDLDKLRTYAGLLRSLLVSMAPSKKHKLPKPLPDGFILTDTEKKSWRLGRIIGEGGFGLIYLASRDVDRPVSADSPFVIKVVSLTENKRRSGIIFRK